jgi:hypothetical protein
MEAGNPKPQTAAVTRSPIMKTRIAGGLAATALALAIAAPAAAATPKPFAYTDTWDEAHACGIIEHVHADVRGAAYFDADGAWLRDIVQFRFDSVFESTVTGRSLRSVGRQVAEFTPDGVTLRGQGVFIRGAGGVLAFDVGRVVAEWDAGTTFVTPKAIPMEGGAGREALEAALCEALG